MSFQLKREYRLLLNHACFQSQKTWRSFLCIVQVTDKCSFHTLIKESASRDARFQHLCSG